MPSVTVLALDHCLLSGVVGPLEIFTIANTLAHHGSHSTQPFTPLRLAGMTNETPRGFSALPITVHGPLAEFPADILILPPIFGPLEPVLEQASLMEHLRKAHAAGTVLASCCAGSFLLAEAGLLDGTAATTHWKLVDQFRARYPNVRLEAERMLIDGGSYVCAGGAMAWQDLALHLVARFMSPEVASATAKTLVMDGTRHVQTPYFIFDQHAGGDLAHADAAVNRARQWLQDHYAQPISLKDAAEHAGLGLRTFIRRFKKATGQTPLSYLQQLRIEAARHLLEVSHLNMEEITAKAGYADASSFRRLFKTATGLTPGAYRARFNRSV